MKIITINDNEFDENTYIILLHNKTIIIDPGSSFKSIKAYLGTQQITLVLLTHGHYDHISSITYFKKTKIYAHLKEKKLLADPLKNLSFIFLNPLKITDINFFNGMKINLECNITAYHTPGHTMGSVIYVIENNIFTGDTLFFDTVGRTDLPTGNEKLLHESLKLFSCFNKNSNIFPGHGKPFILKDAFLYNNFISKL